MQNDLDSQIKARPPLTISQAAKYLGVSIDTIRRWEKAGRLIALRSPGKHRYFKKSELDRAFDQKYQRYNLKTKSKAIDQKNLDATEPIIRTSPKPAEVIKNNAPIVKDGPKKKSKIPKIQKYAILALIFLGALNIILLIFLFYQYYSI